MQARSNKLHKTLGLEVRYFHVLSHLNTNRKVFSSSIQASYWYWVCTTYTHSEKLEREQVLCCRHAHKQYVHFPLQSGLWFENSSGASSSTSEAWCGNHISLAKRSLHQDLLLSSILCLGWWLQDSIALLFFSSTTRIFLCHWLHLLIYKSFSSRSTLLLHKYLPHIGFLL